MMETVPITEVPVPDNTFQSAQPLVESMRHCRMAQACYDRGDMAGYTNCMNNVPLDPLLAIGILRTMGKRYVLEKIKRERLVDAEKFYGSDWLERYGRSAL